MQPIILPDSRLRTAIPYLTPGGFVADVGTDHAYLPIYLVHEGYSSRALAADINLGPIRSARANIAVAGLSDRIETLQTDGLHGVERYAPDDVLIFGMGGELIVKILSEAEWIRTPRVGLVLQPMTRASVLRAWLLENGFEIVGEQLSFEDKYYQTIAARWSGECACYSEEELMLGRWNIRERGVLFEGFVKHEITVLDRIIQGKARSEDADTAWELRMKTKLEGLL